MLLAQASPRAGLIRQHLLHWEKSVSFLISCQAVAVLCLMVLRICHRFLSSYCHLLVPPPTLLWLLFPPSPSPTNSPSDTHTSAVIREHGPYKGPTWELDLSPSVQPHHQWAHNSQTLGAAPQLGPPYTNHFSTQTLFLYFLPAFISHPCLLYFTWWWKKIYPNQANSSCFNKTQAMINITCAAGRNRQHCDQLLTALQGQDELKSIWTN